ncbi:MAG: hypothetical protein NTY63_09030 [Candidatus Bipolaricaulota bacterium]|nr:hypothetical protein [Candidatus Bipolaricaulota bacterium]
MREGDEDVTVMRILVEGVGMKGPTQIAYHLDDRFDRAARTSAIARTTGYTVPTAVRMLAAGMWTEKGIIPPERIWQRAA